MNESRQNRIMNFRLARVATAMTGGFVGLTMVAVLFMVWTASRDAMRGMRGTPLGNLLHPVRLETPFTLFKGGKPGEFARTANVPIYPGAVGQEFDLSTWHRIHNTTSGGAAGLAFFRFHTPADVADVDKWYQEHLGEGFTRTKSQVVALEDGKDDWIRRLPKDSNGQAVLFRRDEVGRGRGISLEPDASGKGALITVFYHTEPGT